MAIRAQGHQSRWKSFVVGHVRLASVSLLEILVKLYSSLVVIQNQAESLMKSNKKGSEVILIQF